jgi:predicted metal-dependent phosphoesterase TrpH
VRIDLHTHSAASDGTDAPAEVVRAAAKAGLDVVALTDHDTTSGWEQAAATARRLGVALVPGMEISCQADGVGVHLLCYLHDPDDAALRAETDRTRDDRLSRARRMVERLAADVPISWDDVAAQVEDGATVGRPHLADALVARGVVGSREEAFADLLHNRSPYYVRHYAPDALTAVRLVRAAGGVPVMAHPRAGRRGLVVSDEVIAELADAGLAGLEADHRDHLPAERVALRGLARDLRLLVTGSSDYHGAGKVNELGEHTTSPPVFEAIEAQGSGTAVVR